MPPIPPTTSSTATLFEADGFTTGGGVNLGPIQVAHETYGTFTGDNAVFVCHALTGDAHATSQGDPDARPGWWETMIGPGRPIDTNRFFVVCANLLGGCQGTTGPSSTNPATGSAWGLDFPILQMQDFVAVHLALGQHLGIGHWHSVVGGSLGGMQVLEWATTHPETLDNAVVIASSSRLTAQNIAFSAVARQAIMQDEHFHDGRFADHQENPDVGLATARMLAHITYLSESAFDEKFGREYQTDDSSPGFGVDFAVESYLHHQGNAFLTRFDALSYLYLSRVMDYFDPFGAEHWDEQLRVSPVRFLVVSFDSDWRFSTAQSRRIVRVLESAGQPVSFREIHSVWGHDSFLLTPEGYLETVEAFMSAPELGQPSGPAATADSSQGDVPRIAGMIEPNSRVLDLGCGDGSLLQALIQTKQCTGTGVDNDPSALLATIRRGVPVLGLDLAEALGDVGAGSYDTVVLSRTLQVVRDPEGLLRQMARIGDRLIVSMPNFAYWRNRLRLLGGRMPQSRDLPFSWYDTPNLHHATLGELEQLFDRVGLRVVERTPLATGRPSALVDRWPTLFAGACVWVLEPVR